MSEVLVQVLYLISMRLNPQLLAYSLLLFLLGGLLPLFPDERQPGQVVPRLVRLALRMQLLVPACRFLLL